MDTFRSLSITTPRCLSWLVSTYTLGEEALCSKEFTIAMSLVIGPKEEEEEEAEGSDEGKMLAITAYCIGSMQGFL